MVSFDTRHRHLGRLAAERPAILLLLPVHALVLAVGFLVGGLVVPVAIVLGSNLLYAFFPALVHLRQVVARASA